MFVAHEARSRILHRLVARVRRNAHITADGGRTESGERRESAGKNGHAELQ